jgi:hypothetical protein
MVKVFVPQANMCIRDGNTMEKKEFNFNSSAEDKKGKCFLVKINCKG